MKAYTPHVAVRSVRGGYPAAIEGFAPSQPFVELGELSCAAQTHEVFDAVRSCLNDVGCDAAHAGTERWNPFSHLVRPGGTVLVMPNFVHHRRASESMRDFLGKCTHASVLRPVLEYARLAVGPTGRVRVGNAPVQSGDWAALGHETGLTSMFAAIGREPAWRDGPSLEAVDLRAWVLDRSLRGEARSEGVSVDLASDSLLDAIGGASAFRVMHYDPEQTARFHGPARHVYRLSRVVLDADLVVSVPKLKTHNKVGVTLSLKGCVGAIAEKDCLAHHRRGAPAQGGDEYPQAHPVLVARSLLGERVWRKTDHGSLARVGRMFDMALGRVAHEMGLFPAGSWSGNDTCWRMALDIARCLRYADRDGTLHDVPQRNHVALADGVVGGEGEGPLGPTAIESGCVLFSEDPFALDAAATAVMGFDPRCVPIVARAADPMRWALTERTLDAVTVSLDGIATALDALPGKCCRRFRATAGWRSTLDR
jgi:uncharacterized protein (DUF362 family)